MITLNYPFPGDRRVETLKQIDSVIQSGGVIIYPTETFYALGGNALNHHLGQRLSEIKQRPLDKPFPCLAGNRKAIDKLVSYWPKKALQMADRYWPGALTLVLDGLKTLPSAIHGKDGSIAVRWSPHPLIDQLARLSHLPLISTSANFSGQPPTSQADQLDPQLLTSADLLIIADKDEPETQPSTIIDARVDPPILLRPGAVEIPGILSRH